MDDWYECYVEVVGVEWFEWCLVFDWDVVEVVEFWVNCVGDVFVCDWVDFVGGVDWEVVEEVVNVVEVVEMVEVNVSY